MPLSEVLNELGRSLQNVDAESGLINALPGETRLARELGRPLPIVQGPMARISDCPPFLKQIEDSGATPVLAFASLPPDRCAELWKQTRHECPHAGVGIIGLDLQMPLVEQQVAVLETERPPFILVAAPSPHLVESLIKRRFTVLAHAPHVMALQELHEIGCRRFVLEGNESGGHIGRLSSTILWQLVLEDIVRRDLAGDLVLVFAGGLATGAGTTFLRALITAYGLSERLTWGMQIGTAYLATREVVESGAMSRNYRNWVLNEERTLVTGESIGLRARQVASPFVHGVLVDEDAACREGLSLPDRRIRFEKANLGNLARAVASKEGEDGCFMAGESVALLDRLYTLSELHEELIGIEPEKNERIPPQ